MVRIGGIAVAERQIALLARYGIDEVFLALYFGLRDGGRPRVDHGDYYDAQLEFLLRQLWSIPSQAISTAPG